MKSRRPPGLSGGAVKRRKVRAARAKIAGRAQAAAMPEPAAPTAKLFMSGRSQAVRLPKAFRFAGDEVLVSKVGDKVILEPVKKAPIDVEALWARLDALGARDFLPDGLPDDPPLLPDDDVSFD